MLIAPQLKRSEIHVHYFSLLHIIEALYERLQLQSPSVFPQMRILFQKLAVQIREENFCFWTTIIWNKKRNLY